MGLLANPNVDVVWSMIIKKKKYAKAVLVLNAIVHGGAMQIIIHVVNVLKEI